MWGLQHCSSMTSSVSFSASSMKSCWSAGLILILHQLSSTDPSPRVVGPERIIKVFLPSLLSHALVLVWERSLNAGKTVSKIIMSQLDSRKDFSQFLKDYSWTLLAWVASQAWWYTYTAEKQSRHNTYLRFLRYWSKALLLRRRATVRVSSRGLYCLRRLWRSDRVQSCLLAKGTQVQKAECREQVFRSLVWAACRST